MPERKRRIPSHIFGGRFRTSTAALIVAFVAILWLQQIYEPEPEPPPQVVPPGYIPNPEYTWVPRTDVRTSPQTTTPAPTTTTMSPTMTTTPTTTIPSPTTTTTTTSPTTTTTPSPREAPATTVIDPDGPGPAPPTTVVETDDAGPIPPGQVPTTTTTRGPLPGLP